MPRKRMVVLYNMPAIVVTKPTFHPEISALKDVVWPHIYAISVTDLKSQPSQTDMRSTGSAPVGSTGAGAAATAAAGVVDTW